MTTTRAEAAQRLAGAAEAVMMFVRCCAEHGDAAIDVIAVPAVRGAYAVRRGDSSEGWVVYTGEASWDFEEVEFGAWPPHEGGGEAMSAVIRFRGILMTLRHFAWVSKTDPDLAAHLSSRMVVPGPDDPEPEHTMLAALKAEYGDIVVVLREPDRLVSVPGRIY